MFVSCFSSMRSSRWHHIPESWPCNQGHSTLTCKAKRRRPREFFKYFLTLLKVLSFTDIYYSYISYIFDRATWRLAALSRITLLQKLSPVKRFFLPDDFAPFCRNHLLWRSRCIQISLCVGRLTELW